MKEVLCLAPRACLPLPGAGTMVQVLGSRSGCRVHGCLEAEAVMFVPGSRARLGLWASVLEASGRIVRLTGLRVLEAVMSVPGGLARWCCFHSVRASRAGPRGSGVSPSWDRPSRSVSQVRIPGPGAIQDPNPLYTIGTNHSFILLLKVPFRVEVSVDLVFLVE